jgi:phosphonate transport system permease protein
LTDARPPASASAIPAPPAKSVMSWLLDLVVWGGIAAVLIYSIDAVDLGNLSQLVTNSDQIQNFARELLRPDLDRKSVV